MKLIKLLIMDFSSNSKSHPSHVTEASFKKPLKETFKEMGVSH